MPLLLWFCVPVREHVLAVVAQTLHPSHSHTKINHTGLGLVSWGEEKARNTKRHLLDQVPSIAVVMCCWDVVTTCWKMKAKSSTSRGIKPFYPLKVKKVKVIFCPVLPGLRKSIALWKVSRPHPFVLLVRAICRRSWVWNIDGFERRKASWFIIDLVRTTQ